MLLDNQVHENYDKLFDFIENTFDGERRTNLLELHHYFGDRLKYAPASGKIFFHNCFPGGYVDHVLNVINKCKIQNKAWEAMGGKIDYTMEELMFCALVHDIGKVGDLENDYYVQTEEKWKISRGQFYDHNPKMDSTPHQHLSMFLLQHFKVQVNLHVWIAIMIHDDMYDEANSRYLKNYTPEREIKFNLPKILHISDYLATRNELEKWKESEHGKSFLRDKNIITDPITSNEINFKL